MRGNFSLTRFPDSQRGSLRMQQGRPLLDSDWNAQAVLSEQAIRERIESLVGPSGAPAEAAGFRLVPIPALDLNQDKDRNHAEGILLAASPHLPFPIDFSSAEPFHIRIGFKITKDSSGTLCHIPGLLRLSVNDKQQLRLTATVRAGDGKPKDISVTEKSPLAVNRLLQTDIAYDGETAFVTVLEDGIRKAELSLTLLNPEPAPFDPVGLVLGCRQTMATLIPDNNSIAQGPAFDQPLCASFWQLIILNDRAEAAWPYMPEETSFDQEAGRLVCWLDFSDIRTGWLKDRSGNNAIGLLMLQQGQANLILLDMIVTPGDYLVYGTLYKNHEPCLLSAQPHLPPSGSKLTSEIPGEGGDFYRFYLDCWPRLVTDLEAPENHDPALGNIDTTADLRVLWQIKYLKSTDQDWLEEQWSRLTAQPEAGKARLKRKTSYQTLSNGLLRVEIHHSGWSRHWPLSRSVFSKSIAAHLYEGQRQRLILTGRNADLEEMQLDRPLLIFTAPLYSESAPDQVPVTASIVHLQRKEGDLVIDLDTPAPAAGKEEGIFILPLASYKFSTQNGCLAYPVSELVWLTDQNQLSADLAFPGYNGLDIKIGSWMELGNREQQELEKPGLLFEVQDFIPDRLQLILQPQQGHTGAANTSPETGTFPTLTVWEGMFSPATAPIAESDWQLLADGIELQFEAGKYYKSGQYWSAAMREALPTGIEWPGLAEGDPVFLTPEGPRHDYVPLADLFMKPHQCAIEDLRRIYRALVNEPLSDLDEETAELLFKIAKLMKLLGLENWQVDWENLPYILDELVRFVLDGVYEGKLRLLGSDPVPAHGLISTDETVRVSGDPFLYWQETHQFPDQFQGEVISAELAGQTVLVSRYDNSIRTWSASDESWITLTHIPDQREDYTITWDNNGLYVVGGHVPQLFSCWKSRRIMALDATGSWRIAGFIPRRIKLPLVGCNGDFLFVASGFNHRDEPWLKNGCLNLKTRRWKTLSENTVLPNAGAASLFYKGKWLIFGGEIRPQREGSYEPEASLNVYDPLTDTWRQKAAMPKALTGHRLLPTEDGIYAIGGKSSGGSYSADCYLYNPFEDCWKPAGELLHGRAFFGLLPHSFWTQDQIAVIGGFLRDKLPADSACESRFNRHLYLYR